MGFAGKERDELSFNLVFHVASALASVLLIYALLRLQSLVRFHGQLWQSLDPSRRAVQLDWPALFLQKLGQAFQIPVDGLGEKGQPQKINVNAWVTAHTQLGFQRISWQAESTLLLVTRQQDTTGQWVENLEKALGGQIKIQLKPVGTDQL